MKSIAFNITKSSGERAKFSIGKLRASLQQTGADKIIVNQILDTVRDELYQGISTKEIYNRAFALLKAKNSYFASKYKLKKAIYELGPTGFPFEHFVSKLFEYSGYKVEVSKILQGECVTHEVDVLAHKNGETSVIECKFHSEQGLKCNVKVPLYIDSRFRDIKAHWNRNSKRDTKLTKGLVVTNTRFTEDALQYGNCCGLKLISWDYPNDNSLKVRIDRLGLYPITVSTLLTGREKQFLLGRNIVLCRCLLRDDFLLDHLGISDLRKEKILNEIRLLSNSNS